ncbi:serine hydrolase domain-containing protein [Aurantivibrio plasticivorans]
MKAIQQIIWLFLLSCIAIATIAQEGISRTTGEAAQSASGRQASGLGRGRPDTPLYFASSAAATRAIALCSGLWDANQTIQDIDNYSPLRQDDAEKFTTHIDEKNKTVSIQYADNMPPRHVIWRPVLGCTQLPVGAELSAAASLPQINSKLRAPNLDDQPWPTGDQNARGSLPSKQQQALDALVAKAFDGDTYSGKTWGVIVVHKGKIVAEQYDLGYNMHKGAQTHSAAKSFASTLVGIAVKDYGLQLQKKGVLQAWQNPADPRHQITLEHLLRMSSGLYGEGNGSPQADIYANGATVEGRAVTNFLHTLPGTRFVYNPPDTMLAVRAVREKVNNDQTFWAMPFTELFWKIGMTRTTPSSDWNGDFLMSGQTYSTARDFARFGLLYMNKGQWNGEQILPKDWHQQVRSKGPVQPNMGGRGYGLQFWLYGGLSGLPEDAYTPGGGQGQYAVIIPSRDTIVVRRGYDQPRAGFKITEFTADVLDVLQD